jgi:DNA-binding NarL/FixJ family response regulator
MIRVLIADDLRLVRQGIILFLKGARDIEIVGQARDGYEAVQMTTQLMPDLVVMDADMPRLDGLQATKIIRSSGLPTRVIILSGFADDKLQHKAREYGAQAYLLKTSGREELLQAIRAAVASEQ